MFTGLIEELGIAEKIRQKGNSLRLTVRASKILEDIKVGDSIAVNGACLTVTDFNSQSFSVDVGPETLRRTILSRLHPGEKVNLERAVKVSDRLGGHLVSGHIDGRGEIKERKREKDNLTLKISVSRELTKYIIPQGSLAVDGISLTVAKSSEDSFTVAIVPYTARVTTLGHKSPGNYVNIEVDSLGKYVEKLLRNPQELKKSKITANFLAEKGFK